MRSNQCQNKLRIKGALVSMLPWRRPFVQFHCPDAESVALVVEGRSKPLPMRKNGRGTWRAELPHLRKLVGKTYHFEVCNNGNSAKIADPFAHCTSRDNGELVSYFSDIQFESKQ